MQRRLERRLNAAIIAIASLKNEIDKHEQWLASESLNLETLEKVWEAEEARKKRNSRKVGHGCPYGVMALI